MTGTFPPNIGAVAIRALERAGVHRPAQLARWTESDVLALRGIGPKTIATLRPFLAGQGAAVSRGTRPTKGVAQVDAYLAGIVSPHRQTLEALRATIRSILPHADEALKYGMPAFTLGGKGVVGYAAFKDHCSYLPMSGAVLERAGDAVAGYETSKGGIRFGADERLPTGLIRRLVKLRIEEISAVANGRRCEYYGDGRLKAEGRMKDGQLHGHWKWYRQDGTLMRAGQFANGDRVGAWTTWDRDGTNSKTTQF